MARMTLNTVYGFIVTAMSSGADILIYHGATQAGSVTVGAGASYDLAFLPDGSLLLVYTAEGAIVRKQSKDLGATWQNVT